MLKHYELSLVFFAAVVVVVIGSFFRVHMNAYVGAMLAEDGWIDERRMSLNVKQIQKKKEEFTYITAFIFTAESLHRISSIQSITCSFVNCLLILLQQQQRK